MKRKLRAVLLAGALAVGLTGYQATPASAAIDTDLVLAAVTGYTTAAADPTDPTFQPATGNFKGFTMAGAFVACSGAACEPYAGTVTVNSADGDVDFDTTQNLLVGAGSLAINGPEDLDGSAGTLTGQLTDGSFVRVGTVAIAEFDLTYAINGASGEVAAVAAIVAVPGATPPQVSGGDPACAVPDFPPDCTLVTGLVAGGVDPVLADPTRPGDIVQGVLDGL